MSSKKLRPVDYLSVSSGKLELWCEETMELSTDKPAEVAIYLAEHGEAATLLHSSSVDFADEYGCEKKGDGWAIWNQGK